MAADPSDLTDVASVEAFLRLPSNTPDASLLQMLITGISGEIVTQCERESFLAVANATEVRNGNGRLSLPLLKSPVWTVSSVTIDTFAVQQAATPLLAGWILDTDYGPPPQSFLRIQGLPPSTAAAMAFLGPLYFTRGFQNVSIVLSYGYNTPGQVALSQAVPGAPSLPADLKLAATMTVAFRYRQLSRWGESGMTMPSGVRVNYLVGGFPDPAMQTFQRWKQTAPIEN